jgi:ribosomal protein L40E
MNAANDGWICMDCAARNAGAGNCARCGEGPLLDLRDAQVRGALHQQDEERGRAKSRKLLAVAAAIGAVLGFPIVFTLGAIIGLLGVVAFGGLIFLVLRAVFPYKPRFADIP